MTHTTFKNKPELLKEIKEAVDNLKEKLWRVNSAFTETGGILKKDSYHYITRILKSHTRTERTLYGFIHQTAYKAEMMSAGAGFLSVAFSVSLLDQLIREQDSWLSSSQTELVEPYQYGGRVILKEICSLSKRPTREDISKTIHQICQDNSSLAQALDEAIDLAGVEGNIRIEQGKQPCYVVELKHGYSFALDPYKMFLGASGGNWLEDNVKVLLMDGMVEKVSEIEHLLNGSINSKQPMMIIAQGFSEEVVATLKLNTDKGSFNIIPMRLQPDLAGLNLLNDLSAVVGSDVLSALKGEQITFKSYDSIPTVERVHVNQDNTIIQNSSTRGSVALQIKMLVDKKNQPNVVEDVGTLLDKRITSLLSHAVVFGLPGMTQVQEQDVRVKIDVCLRTVRSILRHGTVDFREVVARSSKGSLLLEPLDSTLQLLPEENVVMPTMTVCAGTWFACQTVMMVMSAAGVVEID